MIGSLEPLSHPVQLPRGVTNEELNRSPSLAKYLKIDERQIRPWKLIQEQLTGTPPPGRLHMTRSPPALQFPLFSPKPSPNTDMPIAALRKLKHHPVELALRFFAATKNMTEEELSELLEVTHQQNFQPDQLPKNLYEYKRYKEHLLPIQRLKAYEYRKESDGKVCPIAQPHYFIATMKQLSPDLK